MGKTGRKWTQNRIHFWILIWKREIQPEKMNYSIIWACYLRFTDLKVPPLPWIALQTENIRKGDQVKGRHYISVWPGVGGWEIFFQTAVHGFLSLSNEIKEDVYGVLVQSLWSVLVCSEHESEAGGGKRARWLLLPNDHAGWEGMASAVHGCALISTSGNFPHNKMPRALGKFSLVCEALML